MRSFLTPDEEVVYGRFTGPPEQAVLERFFFLDDADRDLIASKRGDHNRLGFSLQLVTVRHLGRFLEDPLDVPSVVVDYVASQIKVADPSCVKAYLERKPTRFEHQAEICKVYGYHSYPSVKDSLLAWVGDQAWATGDGPKALFYSVVAPSGYCCPGLRRCAMTWPAPGRRPRHDCTRLCPVRSTRSRPVTWNRSCGCRKASAVRSWTCGGVRYEVEPAEADTPTSALFRAWCAGCGAEYTYPFRTVAAQTRAA
ncbi:DUF4158 domain-containing protein [Actinoplanes hulinensis]|uniref:DUF4158 domain-containing protein n=1 Tax=Actinoplanes hulinensis TaxID=1144547 RepID=A0ABS7B485_9ACTN|nr:DUF4158 domain-containing protein [Actinoplanes hulinensis]MBW6435839.1 DUF4158 domain-containing protein [Actinoplanes hulinensis]